MTTPLGAQFLRKCSLVVLGTHNANLDLSQFRIHFRTFQSDVQTPNSAEIRIFNLAPATAKAVQKEFQQVTLQAGYQNGPFGIIFSGTIKQVRRGRIPNSVDTYTDILAADGDQGYNFGFVNQTIAAGYQQTDVQNALASALQATPGFTDQVTPGAAQRGKVLFGLARDHMRDFAATNNVSWSVQQGKLQTVRKTSYVPGSVTVLTGQTGLIGLPEQTEGGILVKALINPSLNVGSLVQINDSSIQRAFLGGNLLFAQGRLEQLPGFNALLPPISNDGFYRIYVAEFVGDTRGNDWYVDMTCLAVDRSAAAGNQVQLAATQ